MNAHVNLIDLFELPLYKVTLVFTGYEVLLMFRAEITNIFENCYFDIHKIIVYCTGVLTK